MGHYFLITLLHLSLHPSPKTMSFMVSQAQQSFSENEKVNLNHPEVEDNQVLSTSPVSSQLHLKPSAHAMDRDVILKRIRHHKTVNKVKKSSPSSGCKQLRPRKHGVGIPTKVAGPSRCVLLALNVAISLSLVKSDCNTARLKFHYDQVKIL
ncbi:hypothetical protein OIU76_002199 [Salix suchowensis]|uniref:Uncharacterized protein n=1 Tax=Salix suchowensis TaxID=1278906 RepID=A0ABQ9CFP8_9ROSI|nr:hypothetical protein OIU76_002199 [Salix suchowensis]KAJ6398510.1 hypothetical protein OIU77_019327 [Salix suchowensis]